MSRNGEGVRDHTVQEERIPRAPRQRLFEGRTTVRSSALSPQPADVIYMQGFSLPLQARPCPFAGPSIVSDAVFRARHNRNCALQPDHLRL